MTSEIQIGNFKRIKPVSVRWRCSVSNITDTCSILLPRANYLTSSYEYTEDVTMSDRIIFKEGDKVEFKCGYNGENSLRFKGFISRVNFSIPLELECEGYSYLLRNKIFTKSYKSTSFKEILSDLSKGTEIKLSKYIPDVTLKNVTFRNVPAMKVLEWFQKECLATVYFDFDELFVGASKFAIPKPTQILKLGWNTVNDDEFKKNTDENQIEIHVVVKDETGNKKRTKADLNKKYDNIKEVKIRAGLNDLFVKQVSKEFQKANDYRGYEGNITCFLEPVFEKGFVADVSSERFKDKYGKFFVESIDGSFDNKGGRQKITLKYYGNN